MKRNQKWIDLQALVGTAEAVTEAVRSETALANGLKIFRAGERRERGNTLCISSEGREGRAGKESTGGGGGERMTAPKRSSEEERKGNALASGADEGRDKLRKASGSCK